jgi:hypothetical protein
MLLRQPTTPLAGWVNLTPAPSPKEMGLIRDYPGTACHPFEIEGELSERYFVTFNMTISIILYPFELFEFNYPG